MFRFNKDVEYALISLMELAKIEEGELISARELSNRYSIPYKLLTKILQKLSGSSLVNSVKGSKGGYRLAKEPGNVSLGSVMNAVREPKSIADCMSADGNCVQDDCGCNIKPAIQLFHDKWVNFVNNTTLLEFLQAESAGERLVAW